MSTNNPAFTITEPSGADLSAHEFKGVKMNTSGKIVAFAAITDIPIGIQQTDSADAADKPVAIIPMNSGGISKIRLGATLTPGVLVGLAADGRAVADASTNYTLGLLLIGGDADDLGSVLLSSYTAKV